MDHIRLKDIIVYGHYGTSGAERQMGQRLLLDLDLRLDLTRPSRSDDVQDTVSYEEVYVLVQQVTGEVSCQLLEHLAGRIIEELFTRFAMLSGLTVSLRKMNLPFPNTCREVEVQVSRERGTHGDEIARGI